LRDLFFTARCGEIDPALFKAIEDRVDHVRPPGGVRLGRHLLEILDLRVGKDDGFRRRIGDPFVFSKLRNEF